MIHETIVQLTRYSSCTLAFNFSPSPNQSAPLVPSLLFDCASHVTITSKNKAQTQSPLQRTRFNILTLPHSPAAILWPSNTTSAPDTSLHRTSISSQLWSNYCPPKTMGTVQHLTCLCSETAHSKSQRSSCFQLQRCGRQVAARRELFFGKLVDCFFD